jgi:hypothetical protein
MYFYDKKGIKHLQENFRDDANVSYAREERKAVELAAKAATETEKIRETAERQARVASDEAARLRSATEKQTKEMRRARWEAAQEASALRAETAQLKEKAAEQNRLLAEQNMLLQMTPEEIQQFKKKQMALKERRVRAAMKQKELEKQARIEAKERLIVQKKRKATREANEALKRAAPEFQIREAKRGKERLLKEIIEYEELLREEEAKVARDDPVIHPVIKFFLGNKTAKFFLGNEKASSMSESIMVKSCKNQIELRKKMIADLETEILRLGKPIESSQEAANAKSH